MHDQRRKRNSAAVIRSVWLQIKQRKTAIAFLESLEKWFPERPRLRALIPGNRRYPQSCSRGVEKLALRV